MATLSAGKGAQFYSIAIAPVKAHDALSSAWLQKETKFPLSARTQSVFLISVIIVAWIASLASIPYIGDHPSLPMISLL
jgi:hypothetical protein